MTKSQNTKNEQQKDLCITSEQLTEQWKQGKLPEGLYWVKGSRTKGIYAYTAEYLNNTYRPINGESVIAKVPDYAYWQNLWNTADMEHKANNKLLEDVERLEKENKELKKQVNHLSKTQAQAKDVIDIEATRKIKQLEQIIEGQKQIIESQKQTNLALIKRLEEKVTNVKEALDFLQAESSKLSI